MRESGFFADYVLLYACDQFLVRFLISFLELDPKIDNLFRIFNNVHVHCKSDDLCTHSACWFCFENVALILKGCRKVCELYVMHI